MNRQRWYHRISIILPILLTLLIVVPMMGILSFRTREEKKNLIDSAGNTIYTNLYGSSLLLDGVMDDMVEFAKSICSDKELCRNLQTLYRSDESNPRVRSEVSLALSQMIDDQSSLEDIYVVSEGNSLVISTCLSEKEDRDGSGRGGRIREVLRATGSHKINWHWIPMGDGSGRLCYVRPVSKDVDISFVFLMREDVRKNLVQIPYPDNSIYVCDYDGRVINLYGKAEYVEKITEDQTIYQQALSENENRGMYQSRQAGSDVLVLYYNSIGSGWKYICSVPLEGVYSNTTADDQLSVYIVLLAIISTIMGYLLVRKLVINPMNQITHHMKSVVGNEVLKPYPGGFFTAEMQETKEIFNQMIEDHNKTIDEVYVQQLLRKQAELKSLHAQIDEHFLYNTLNSIYCQAQKEHADETADMLLVMSRYFRYSLSHGNDEVDLETTARTIESYLQLQKIRFGDRMECRIEGFRDMGRYRSLKTLYQPIVENAIIHGLEDQSIVCHITIRFLLQNGMLHFEVEDDGPGITPKRIEEIFSENTAVYSGKKGYALQNIREQLRITYGEGCDIHILSDPGRSTKVYFEIPLKEVESL